MSDKNMNFSKIKVYLKLAGSDDNWAKKGLSLMKDEEKEALRLAIEAVSLVEQIAIIDAKHDAYEIDSDTYLRELGKIRHNISEIFGKDAVKAEYVKTEYVTNDEVILKPIKATEEDVKFYNSITNRNYNLSIDTIIKYEVQLPDYDKTFAINTFAIAESPTLYGNANIFGNNGKYDEVSKKVFEAIARDKFNPLYQYSKDVLSVIESMENSITQIESFDKESHFSFHVKDFTSDKSAVIYDGNYTVELKFPTVENPTNIYDYEAMYMNGDWYGSLAHIATDIVSEERIREMNRVDKENLRKFYEDNIKDKDPNSEEYKEAFSEYSDWHKDVFGYRPRGEFGEYVNPHNNENDEYELDEYENEL